MFSFFKKKPYRITEEEVALLTRDTCEMVKQALEDNVGKPLPVNGPLLLLVGKPETINGKKKWSTGTVILRDFTTDKDKTFLYIGGAVGKELHKRTMEDLAAIVLVAETTVSVLDEAPKKKRQDLTESVLNINDAISVVVHTVQDTAAVGYVPILRNELLGTLSAVADPVINEQLVTPDSLILTKYFWEGYRYAQDHTLDELRYRFDIPDDMTHRRK